MYCVPYGQARRHYPNYTVAEYGTYVCKDDGSGISTSLCTDRSKIATMERKMMAEIATRGPIACCVACGEGFGLGFGDGF